MTYFVERIGTVTASTTDAKQTAYRRSFSLPKYFVCWNLLLWGGNNMILQDHSWTDFGDAETDIAILPVGSTEQHGPHNPLGVDAFVANRLAKNASDRTDAVLLPSIEIGMAEHHRHFDGTLFVSHDTLRNYVQETLQSLTHHDIEQVVVVNGHGGNAAALEEACANLTRDGDLYAVLWQWFDALDESVGHGGKYETSIMMHLAPELVNDPKPGDADTWGKTVHGANVAYDTDEFTKNGTTGNASQADAEIGARIFDEAVVELVGLIEWVRDHNSTK